MEFCQLRIFRRCRKTLTTMDSTTFRFFRKLRSFREKLHVLFLLSSTRIRIIFIRIRIQDLKKFVTDPDPGKKDSVPGNLENWILKTLISNALCVHISKLSLSLNNHLYLVIILCVFHGFCWIRIRIILYGSGSATPLLRISALYRCC